MENIDVKIQKLQNEVEYEKMMPPGNCVKIAKMEMELARLYQSNGDGNSAKQTLEDARSVISSPQCPRSRQKRQIEKELNQIIGVSVINGNPNYVRFPLILRYSGLIILILGYLAIYLLNFFGIITNANTETVLIYVIFAISLASSFIIRNLYMRQFRRRL